MSDSYLTFDAAVARFQRFLGTHGWPTPVIWVRPGDVVRRRGRLVVQVTGCAQSEHHARSPEPSIVAGSGRKIGVEWPPPDPDTEA
jgi:hypothetical protein